MSLEIIKNWLSHKDYTDGIRLYLQYGQDKDLKRLLTSEMKSPYKEARLERALRDVLKGSEVIQEEAKKEPARISAKSWPADSARDEILQALRTQWLTYFKKMQDLRSQLLLLPTVQERGEAAFEILRLDALCDEIYDQRDFYNTHGKLPLKRTADSDIIIDPKKAYNRMEVLKRYIRRERKNIEQNPGNAGAIARRMKWVEEYNMYAKKFSEELIDA